MDKINYDVIMIVVLCLVKAVWLGINLGSVHTNGKGI